MPQSTELGRVVKTIYPVSETLTISSGAVTVEAAKHIIAAESGTADDLATINGGEDFEIISIYADTGDTITVVETGNINLGGSDFTLTSSNRLLLEYDGSKWIAINASSNAGGGGSGIGSLQSFTPTLSYNSGGSVTYTTQIGRYIELSSDLVWVHVELVLNTVTSGTGVIRVSSPVTFPSSGAVTQVLPMAQIGIGDGFASGAYFTAECESNAASFILRVNRDLNSQSIPTIGAGDSLFFTGLVIKQ